MTVTFEKFRGLHLTSIVGTPYIYVSGLNPRLLWVVKQELYSCPPDNVFKGKVLVQLHKQPHERSDVTIRRVSNGDFVKGGIKRCACSVAELHEQTAASLMESYFREPC